MSTGKDPRDNLPTVSYGKSLETNGDGGLEEKGAAAQSKKPEKSDSDSRDQETIANLPHTFVKIDFSDIELGECCGEGSFGTVYRAKWLSQGGKEVAVKTLNRMDEEVHIISVLSHRNVIQFYGACAEKPNFCLITEYAPYGSLFSFLSSPKSENLQFAQMLSWARDVALGMNYLHEQAPIQVVHRDLKSKNVLICNDFVLKICDFGASRLFDETTVMTITGTYPWMAPELIQGLPTSEMCDVYSYGVVLWELLTREIPFKGLQGFQVAWIVVEKKERPLIPTTCPRRLAELMKKCWQTDSSLRPTFGELTIEINDMINDAQLEKETDSFVHAKNDWMLEVKDKMKDIHHQETKFEAKEDDFMERERKLKQWAEKLRDELREKSLHNLHVHYSKMQQTFNCEFSSSVSGGMDEDTVKDVMNQFMSSSGLPNRSKEDMERKMSNFQAAHSPTSIIGMPLSRQGSSSSVESSRSLSLHSDMNYDMSKVSINTSPVSFLDSTDAFPRSKDKPKTLGRSRTKLQKQISTSSEEFQFEGLKLARGANGSESPLNGGKGVNTWESSKAKFKDSQENFISENESMKLVDNFPSPTSPDVQEIGDKTDLSFGVVDEALKRMKMSGIAFDHTLTFASQLSKFLQNVSNEKRAKVTSPSLFANDPFKGVNSTATKPLNSHQQSPTSEKSISFERNKSSFAKKEQKQSAKLFQAKSNAASVIGRSLNKVDKCDSEKPICKNAIAQTEGDLCIGVIKRITEEKGTQTYNQSPPSNQAANKRKILFHCLPRPQIAEICQDVPQSEETDEVPKDFQQHLPRASPESSFHNVGNGSRHHHGPSTITTQSTNNSLRHNMGLNLNRQMGGIGHPRRRVTITGAPPFESRGNRSLHSDTHVQSPPILSPTQINFDSAVDISGGRQSVFETDDFTYILRPSMSR